MLYHIDNTPEMPSDRFGTGGKQQFTDPVDPTDRAYINYWIKIWIDLCYRRWREVYWSPARYYRYSKERIMWDFLDDLYIQSKTDWITWEIIEEEKVIINNDDKIIIVLCALIVFLTWALVFVLI